MLTVQHEFECLAIEVERRMSAAAAVCQVLLRLFGERSTPAFVRSDNGPEFVAKALVPSVTVLFIRSSVYP